MEFAAFYGNGAVMGFTPAQVDEMSLWEFAAASEGYRRSMGGDDPVEAPSDERFLEWVKRG